MSEKKLESLHGNLYDVKIEDGIMLCPKCNGILILRNPNSNPDYYHYSCISCLSDFKMENKSDKDFKFDT